MKHLISDFRVTSGKPFHTISKLRNSTIPKLKTPKLESQKLNFGVRISEIEVASVKALNDDE